MTIWMNLPKQPPLKYNAPYPWFTRIAIETASRCNRSCSFCPVSTGRRDFTSVSMNADTFEKIAAELETLRWAGFIELYLENEPLIDPLIYERAARLRQATPKSTIYISTNGDPLGKDLDRAVEKLQRAYASGINSINLNVYDPGPSQHAYYEAIVRAAQRVGIEVNPNKYSRVPTKRRWLSLTDMRVDRDGSKRTDVFFYRTYEERRTAPSVPDAYCARPHRHLVIRYDGKVPLCCIVDPTHPDSPYVADVTTMSLSEAWNVDALAKHRYFLQSGKRAELRECRTCDHKMAYPHIVRKIEAPVSVIKRWRTEER